MQADEIADTDFDFFRPTDPAAIAALSSHMAKVAEARRVQETLIKQAEADGAYAVVHSAGRSVVEGFVFKQPPPEGYRLVKSQQYASLYTVDGIEKASYPLLKLKDLPPFRVYESTGRRQIDFPIVFESASKAYLAVPKSMKQQPSGFTRVLRDDLVFEAQMSVAKRDAKPGAQRRPG